MYILAIVVVILLGVNIGGLLLFRKQKKQWQKEREIRAEEEKQHAKIVEEYERKLEESARAMELALNIAQMMQWQYDCKNQQFVLVNEKIVSDRKILKPEDYYRVVHPDYYREMHDMVALMNKGTDAPFSFDTRMQKPGKAGWHYVTIAGIPIEKDKYGRVIRYMGFRRDNTESVVLNEELEDRTRKIDLAIKIAGIVHWNFNAQTGIFKTYNDELNDYDPDVPLTPENYLEAIHPEDRERTWEIIHNMQEGVDEEFEFEFRSRTKWDDDWQNMLICGVPVAKDADGRVIRYTGLRSNHTKWVKMTEELIRLKEKAEQSDKLKSAFLANMSHEIRTPLNAIVGFSQLMVECEDKRQKEQYREIISSNSNMLLRLISDILDLSKLEAGYADLKREKFDLSQHFNAIGETMRQRITSPEVSLKVVNPYKCCRVMLDKNRFTQVVTNFVSNAVKYTKRGEILMGYELTEDGVLFFVKDTGIGISEDKKSKVFMRFEKLDEFAQGTGLGLSICKAIAEASGGKVGFDSQEGVGSTFWFRAVCETEVVVQGQDKESADTRLIAPALVIPQGIRILVAEDNDSNFLLVQHILKNYRVTRVINGAEAVEKVRAEQFDIVLMDMMMPVMSGLEATAKIREFNKEIPIIALTANAFDSDKVQAIAAGCNGYVTKPLNKQDLLDTIAGYSAVGCEVQK